MSRIKRILAVLLLTMLVIPTFSVDAKEIKDEPVVGYIYLGDSRFVGMNTYVHMDEMNNTYVVAKVGQGLNWLKKAAIKKIDSIISANQGIDEWIIITGLGVNDLGNVDKYIEYYDTLEDVTLILVSVNPVDKSKCDRYGYNGAALGKGIKNFNKKLQDTNYEYIDTYTELCEAGFGTVDGLHYTKDTYNLIYDLIEEYLDLRDTEIQD